MAAPLCVRARLPMQRSVAPLRLGTRATTAFLSISCRRSKSESGDTIGDVKAVAKKAPDTVDEGSAIASNITAVSQRGVKSASTELSEEALNLRLPRSVQAAYLRPLRREAEYGIPTCDLQLRSYSVRNLEFFADFAMRAAYYLNLPAFGPVPLPRITERWTVPRSNFIFKKSQENFERVTVRRLIQIKDGHSESVQVWLAFLRKHAYFGVGMKANVWDFEKLGVGKTMDDNLKTAEIAMEDKWLLFGRHGTPETADKVMEVMERESFRAAATGHGRFVRETK